MGCDIHFYVDKKVGDTWVTADIWETQRVIDPGYYYDNDPEGDIFRQYNSFYQDGRNYELFALLGGVRMYDDTVRPIAARRGVPKDASPEYLREVNYMGSDGHSHSWCTLYELIAADGLEEVSPALVHDTIPMLLGVGHPDEVRILFFFDN